MHDDNDHGVHDHRGDVGFGRGPDDGGDGGGGGTAAAVGLCWALVMRTASDFEDDKNDIT